MALSQETIDEVLPDPKHLAAARRFVDFCPYSTTALMAFIAILREGEQLNEARILEGVIERFAEEEMHG